MAIDKNNIPTSVCDVLQQCHELYVAKNAEYQKTDDPFENFTQGAALNGSSKISTLWGYVTKQIVSLASLIRHPPYQHDLMYEKARDILVYMAILIAILGRKDT
jgi:hypothetical protein